MLKNLLKKPFVNCGCKGTLFFRNRQINCLFFRWRFLLVLNSAYGCGGGIG